MDTRKEARFGLQLAILTLSRLVINTGLRLTYPFLPELARGLGVSLAAASRLVALRALAGFFSPLFSPLSERFGTRPVVAGSMLVLGLGCLVVAIWPAYWPLGVTLAAIGLMKVTFDPAMQAYVGDTVPYRQRGKVIATTELSWAGALLLGAPAAGFVIQRQGWQAPFLWLGLFGLIAAVALWRVIPPGRVQAAQVPNLRAVLGVVRRHPVIWAAAAYVLLAMMANELIFIVYGGWMEQSFGLTLTNLGLATGVIGGAEVLGELTAGWSVDRFGKRPVIITTGLLTALAYVAIPYTGPTLVTALGTLFAVFLAFEITLVGGIPLMTEVVPGARSVVMSAVLAAGSLGRALGDLIGPEIWVRAGLPGNGAAAAAIMLVAVLILVRWVREGSTGTDEQ